MKYYKKPDLSVWAFEPDGSTDKFITPDMVPMTAAEVETHINPPPTPEQAREAAKSARALAVAAITVTTASGKTFDGDEASQDRMARAILALQAAGATSTLWVLADNTPTTVTAAELGAALALAGAAQSAIWVIP